ncbi:unnamed protein product [Notodromas monacha]|uniref:Uncharacterized protein n=2 Tax=Notodromas monacha TaxID=399045 RepID=A0A7R9BIU9_9CRUS|nr:unnamed protein product [Notodromas monacha]CAG0915213.1 unnamed protein product [Notodromas monacha]
MSVFFRRQKNAFGGIPLTAFLFILFALALLAYAPSGVEGAIRARRPGGIKIFESDENIHPAFDNAMSDDDDDEADDGEDSSENEAREDEICDEDSCVDSENSPGRNRQMRRAGDSGMRKPGMMRKVKRIRRKSNQRMFLSGSEGMDLKDEPGHWHWYLLWGSLLVGTLTIAGSNVSYFYVLVKSQVVDKFKPVFKSDDGEAIGVMYHFSHGDSVAKTAKKLKLGKEVAQHWYNKCQVVAQAQLKVCSPQGILNKRGDDPQDEYDRIHYVNHFYQSCPRFMVGGFNKTVEVDLAPVDKIFEGEWGLVIVEKPSWRCYVLPIDDPSQESVIVTLRGRVREGSKVFCHFIEPTGNNNSSTTQTSNNNNNNTSTKSTPKGALLFDVNDYGELVVDPEGKRKRLTFTEPVIKHVIESLNGELVDEPNKVQTALVQFMWLKAFVKNVDGSLGVGGSAAAAAGGDIEPFLTFVAHVAKFFGVEAGRKTPAKKMTYRIDGHDSEIEREVDDDEEGEGGRDQDAVLQDFGGVSPNDSDVPTPNLLAAVAS